MKKTIKIEGMTCGHCQKRVEDTLNKLPGFSAKVNLKKEEAKVNVTGDWNEQLVREVIGEAGYEVISVSDTKSFFGR